MHPNSLFRWLSAGSLTAALVLMAAVPFNMGGCGSSNLDVSSVLHGANFNVGGGTSVNAGQLFDTAGKAGQSFSLGPNKENALGQSVSLSLTNQYGVTKNDQLAKYVMFVGMAVAQRTPRPQAPWVFGVLDTDVVNAWSGPGGYVWVTRGAIQQMQDESELAGILAHEIGHVVAQHGLKAAQEASTGDVVTSFAKSFNNSTLAQVDQFLDKGVDAVLKGHNREQENEADKLGVQYTAKAGYDPNGLLRFLQRIRQQQKSGGANLFSTHPGLDERIKLISDQISAAGTGGRGATLRERFIQATSSQQTSDARPVR